MANNASNAADVGQKVQTSKGEGWAVTNLDRATGGSEKNVLTVSGAGDLALKDTSGNVVLALPFATGVATWGTKQAATASAFVVADPGNAAAISVATSGVCELTSAGAETRTLARPTFVGQKLALICDVYVGNIVVTASAAINQTGNTIMTFGAAADMIELTGMKVAGALVWRATANDGCALS